MKKRIIAAVVAAASVLSLAGCNQGGTSSGTNSGNSSTPAGTSSAAGTNSSAAGTSSATSTPAESVPAVDLKDDDDTLSIAVWGGNGDIQHLIDTFKEKTGTTVNIVAQKTGEGGEDARDNYPDMIDDANTDVDLIICDADWVRNYVEDDTYCLPLSELGISKDEYKDAFAYTLDVGTGNDGVFRGATFQATPGCWFYDVNLAKQYLNVETPEAMQAKVKDWDTFKATAKELAEASEGKVALNATEAGLWQVYQCNRTKPWVVDGKLEMDNAADFYDIAKEMYDAGGLTDEKSIFDKTNYQSMQAGNAMGEFAPTWGLTGVTGSILGDAAGESRRDGNAVYAAVAGPQSWYWGGSYFAVAKSCNTKKTAAEFIRFYTLNANEGMKAYTDAYGDFMNNKSVMGAATYKNPSLVSGQNHFTVIADSAAKIDMNGKLTTYDSKIKNAFNDSVNKYMTGEIKTKEAAIEAFKNQVRSDFSDLTVE